MSVAIIDESYVDQAIPLIKAFHDESISKFGIAFDPEKAKALFTSIATTGVCLGYFHKERLVGIVVGIVAPSFFSPTQTMLQELVWYVLPDNRKGRAGLLLFDKFEQLGKLHEVDYIIMANMSNLDDNVQKFYHNRGYQFMETHHIKKIKE